jgi:hypothetical protein
MLSIGAVGKYYSVNHEIGVVEQSGSTEAGVSKVSICAVRKHSVSNEI